MEDGFVGFIPWMFMGFGVLLAGGSLWVMRSETRGRHWRDVDGHVISHYVSESRDEDGIVSTLYAAEIEYSLPGLPAARLVDDVASRNPPAVGSRIDLRYNPDDHNQVMVWAPRRLGIFYVSFFLMGLTLIAVGIFALYLGPSPA